MLALPFLRRGRPALRGARVNLRPPASGDYEEWATLRGESRAFLEPWEPRWAPDELERPAWRERLSRYREDFARGAAVSFLIFENASGAMTGGITLGNIRYGVSLSAHIGYWMGERYAGRGYMHEALGLVVDHAFESLHMHRLEAACLPNNERSIRVLEKAGFTREGLARAYLKINGKWQDHYLYARIAGAPQEEKRGRT